MANSRTNYPNVVSQKVLEQLAAMKIEDVVGKSVGKAAGKAAGAFVEPALWVIKGEPVDSTDVMLWGVGLTGGIGTVAAFMTGVIKGLVDESIKAQLQGVLADEPEKYRNFIRPALKYGGAGSFINAMTIASKGGTAWMHPNGLWVYIQDAKGRLVPDYNPRKSKEIMHPVLPLQKSGDGFLWKKE